MTEPGDPLVRTRAGVVRGFWREGSAAFLGIPFAAPPVGELRFGAPAPAEPWVGARDATSYGPTPQTAPIAEVTTIPEPSIPGDDTLNVNVFTPGLDGSRPVMVWLHGGGYVAGSPASPWYDGHGFNRDGVVTVTVSYRLGFDGFGWIDGAPANRGLLDQIAALEWVRDNIAAFGGDPDRVTIAGQSAGGGCVLALLASPLADGLFHAAISQSGAPSWLSPRQARESAGRVAVQLGLADTTRETWRSVDPAALVATERAVLAATGLFVATFPGALEQRVLQDTPLRLAFAPVVDGDTVLDLRERLASGAHQDTPLLLGTTLNEFVGPSENPADRRQVDATLHRLGASEIARSAFWEEADRLGTSYLDNQLLTIGLFRLTAAEVAADRARTGTGERTWLYDFRYRAARQDAAEHCQELPFTWGLPEAEGVVEALGALPPPALVEAMHGDWVRFVRDGTCAWPPVAADVRGAQVYDEAPRYDAAAYRIEQEILAQDVENPPPAPTQG